MVWSQYTDEVTTAEVPVEIQNENENEQDDEQDDEQIIPRNRPMNFDDWITWYSDDLLNVWMNIRNYKQDNGIERFFLNDLSWNDFCEMCYEFSSKLPK